MRANKEYLQTSCEFQCLGKMSGGNVKYNLQTKMFVVSWLSEI